MTTRRDLFRLGAAAGLAAGARSVIVPPGGLPPGRPHTDYLPVLTPNGATLPHKIVDGVKVFHLIAEPVEHTFAPGLQASCWGYNGRVHGPTIECVEGDRVRIWVTNKLPLATTVHWHGLHVPSGMDGVGGLSQRPIEPGETFRYEFVLRQHGTFLYHSHHDEMVQMALGLMGLFVVHPRAPQEPRVDVDYAFLLSEWHLEPGMRRPDPNEMSDFNVLTMNGASFPATSPMVARQGERVRIRLGNLSAMDHHPMHLHGHSFEVVATDGGTIPVAGRWPEATVLVPVGSTRTIEFVADHEGDWAFHCHMTHHVMTQMGHGIPNLIGLDATLSDHAVATAAPVFEHMGEDGASTIPANSAPMQGGKGPYGAIAMGGMLTLLKVRGAIDGRDDPGWYTPPAGTLAAPATAAELERDGIQP